MPGTVDLTFVTEDVTGGEFLQWGDSVSNVTDLVDKAIAQSTAQGSEIGRMVIASHGAENSTGFVTFDAETSGAEVIDGSFSSPIANTTITEQLERLGPHFGDESIIELRICEAGTGDNGNDAMQAIADAAGVPVTAPMGSISALAAIGGLFTSWKTVYPTSWGKGIEISMWRGDPTAAPANLSSATTEPAGQYVPMAEQTPPAGLMPPSGGEFVQTVIDNNEVAMFEGEPISFGPFTYSGMPPAQPPQPVVDITDPTGLGMFAKVFGGIALTGVVTFSGYQIIDSDDQAGQTQVQDPSSGEVFNSGGSESDADADDASATQDLDDLEGAAIESLLQLYEVSDTLDDWELPWESATPIDPERERDGVSAGQIMTDLDIGSMTAAIGPDGGEISVHFPGGAQSAQSEDSADVTIGVVVRQDGQQWEIISRDDGETKVPSGVSPGDQVSFISGQWVDPSTLLFIYTGIFIPPGAEIEATVYLDLFGGLMVDILTLAVTG